MSPAQLKKLQELSQVFSQGKANPKQIQQLSALLAQINLNNEEEQAAKSETVSFIAAPRFG
ncbi:hypothetical protein [Colwellia sp. 12G3]|uniref:hypothetical protein n=1 Tax=Colwellia sp. 12G3 TaxID=2058299 RepID=UPI000C333DBE|nr:hypothetical protein [Colwellia sp. 12G3]PKI13793.1 hypothetical protein CXF71_14420 [Colwellia sp. 12G3]